MVFTTALAIGLILCGRDLFVNAESVVMNAEQKQQNLIEMAKKRRHLHLVEKLAKGKSNMPALTKSEIKELENFELPDVSLSVVDSQEKVAKAFGVAVRTIERWIREGMPVASSGRYDLIEIRSWKILRKHRLPKGNRKKDPSEDWDARYREAKAKLAEIEFNKKIGVLVERKDVQKELISISLAVKSALLAMPKSLAPQLVGLETREIAHILTLKARELINQFRTGQIFSDIERSKKNDKDANNIENANALDQESA